MKKYIALLLGLVLGLGFVSCSNDDDDDENVNGEDKYLAELLVTRYNWKDGKRSDEGKLYNRYEYNEKEQLVFRDFGVMGYKMTYTYNADGEMTENRLYSNDNFLNLYKIEYGNSSSVTYVYNPENRLVTTVKNEYNPDGKIAKHTEIIDSISPNYGTVFTYTYSGNTETIEITNLRNGSFERKITKEYDSHGNETKNTITNANGWISTGESVNEYDSNGRLLKKTGPIYDDGTPYGYTEYTYNADGTVKKEHCVNNIETYSQEEYDLEYTYTYKKK